MTMFVFFCSGWETWGHWGDCSSDRTCGQGIKGRRRTCSNGGKIGVDRYCLGLDNQTTTCQSVSCNGKKTLLFPVSYMKVWNTHNLCFKLCKFDRKRIKRCFTIMNMYMYNLKRDKTMITWFTYWGHPYKTKTKNLKKLNSNNITWWDI